MIRVKEKLAENPRTIYKNIAAHNGVKPGPTREGPQGKTAQLSLVEMVPGDRQGIVESMGEQHLKKTGLTIAESNHGTV